MIPCYTVYHGFSFSGSISRRKKQSRRKEGSIIQLNNTTDYAIRIIIYLAKSKHIVSSKKLSEIIDVSPRYLLQISAKLRDAGIVSVTHGSSGGFALLKTSDQISLHDIIELMEGPIQTQQWAKYENMDVTEFNYLNETYRFIDNLLVQSLRNITIQTLLSKNEDQDCQYAMY